MAGQRAKVRTSAAGRTGVALGVFLFVGGGCGGDVDTYRAYVGLYEHTEASVANAAWNLKTGLMDELKTDAVLVATLGEPLRFEGLDAAGPATLHFDWRLFSSEALAGAELRVDTGGGALERFDLASVSVPVGAWGRASVALRGAGPIETLELTVASEEYAGTLIALARPHLRFDRKVTPPSAPPRQVILITTDTLRRDYLGCYGNERVQTTYLDAFADDCVVFEDAISVTNVTNPSHVSIFTSLYLADHGVKDNHSRLAAGAPTLMQEFAAQGLHTGGIVAAANFDPTRSGLAARFDDFHGCTLYHERRAEDVNADAFEWLGEHQDEDFFLWLHYFDVHMPYAPPPPYDTLFTDTGEETIERPLEYKGDPAWFRSSDELQDYENRYRGELAYLDDRLGELFDFLRSVGVYERAWITLVSDHGEALGEHGIYFDHQGLHDETTAVPLLFKLPESARTGRVAGLVSTLDIYPTWFDFLGFELNHPVRGNSLRASIETGAASPQPVAFSEHAHGLQVSARTATQRAIWGLEDRAIWPHFATEAGRFRIYDVTGEEARDVTAETPASTDALRDELQRYLDRELSFEAESIEDEDYLEKLRALGYGR